MELGGDLVRRHAEPTEERGRGLEQREGHPLARVAFWHREREQEGWHTIPAGLAHWTGKKAKAAGPSKAQLLQMVGTTQVS